MSRIDDEKFESILSGAEPLPDDLSTDAELAARLATHRAIRGRLHGAFGGVRPEAAFVEQLQARLAEAGDSAVKPRGRSHVGTIRVHFRRVVWPLLAAAAVLLVVGIPLAILTSQQSAMAAQQELAEIHQRHESPQARLMHEHGDVAEMAAFLRSRVGFDPGRPKVGTGQSLCGCCVDRLMGKDVASYVLRTPRGTVSVVVSRDTPETMKLRHHRKLDDRTVWLCAFGKCNIAATRVDGVSYIVVGELPHEVLQSVLLQIIPDADTLAAGA